MFLKILKLKFGVKEASSLPVLVGSGITTENLQNYLCASGFIVGSHFKHDGQWQNKISEERVTIFMDKVLKLNKEK